MNEVHAPTPLKATPSEELENEHHCACGALLARWVAAGLELKCRRCKRIVTIPFPDKLRSASEGV